MKKFKYMAAMSLFEHFHAEKKNTDEIIACFISNYIKSEKKYSFVLIEITNELNSYYNFNLPIAIVELGISKVPFVSWNKDHKTYYVDSDIWTDSYDSIDFVKQEEKNKVLFNSLVEYVERKKGLSLSPKEKNELLDSLCVFLLEYKTNSPFLDYISSFVLEHEDDSIKSQLESIADGMIVYMGISSDVDVSPTELFEDPITLYLDTEILFHFAGYNGVYYKQQFDEFFNLIREVNKTKKIMRHHQHVWKHLGSLAR